MLLPKPKMTMLIALNTELIPWGINGVKLLTSARIKHNNVITKSGASVSTINTICPQCANRVPTISETVNSINTIVANTDGAIEGNGELRYIPVMRVNNPSATIKPKQ